MLRSFIIFSICFVAIRASGEFSVLSSPKSLSFKGNDVLSSENVGDVLSTVMGKPIYGDVQWAGLTVTDPFNLPKGVVAFYVDGADHVNVNSKAKTYEMQGSLSDASMDTLTSELEANNEPVCDINFEQFDEAVITYRSCFGDLSLPVVAETESLNPSLYSADKQFLQSIAFVNAAADNLSSMTKSSNYLVFRLSLESIFKAHGGKSAAALEANKLVSAAVAKLNAGAQKSSNNNALVVLIANKSVGIRAKRDVVAPNDTKYNLAKYYSPTYPVIFNIILWFMVVFGLALVAICYAIGSMDPGRDSIIYRMTSTRMKKDN